MTNYYKLIDEFIEKDVRIPGQPAWLIFCGYAIGETATFCALAGEFKHHHGHDIVIVITPKHQGVINMYIHQFAKVVLIPDESMRAILRSGYISQDRFELNQAFSPCWIDRGFRESDGIRFLWKYPDRGGISEMDLARMVLHLPWDAKLEPPKLQPEVEKAALYFAIEHGIRPGKSVLLCPINNSAPKFPLFFWNEIAKSLLDQGLTVFTNMGGLNQYNGLSSMPIEGTMPIDLPIEYVIPFIRLSGTVISGANGMYILTALADHKQFQMIQLIPFSENAVKSHSSRGFRSPAHPEIGNAIVCCFQYLAPELCLNVRLNEYLLPYDGEESDLLRLARLVAHKDTTDVSCISRKSSNGKTYVEENYSWLSELRTCVN